MYKRKKNRIRGFFSHPAFFTVFGLLVIFLISLPLAENIRQELAANQEIEKLEQEIEALESRNTEINQLLSFLESDQFVRDQAREKLNYKEEGEEVYVVSDILSEEKQQGRRLASLSEADEKEGVSGNPRKWWNYFFALK